MTLEKDSNIQFDINFDVSNLKNFNVAIIQAIKEREKNFENENMDYELENGIGITNQSFAFHSIFLSFAISTINIEYLRKAHEESKKELSQNLENDQSLERKETIKHGLSLLDKEFKDLAEKFDKPQGNIRLKFEAKDTIDENDFQRAFMNNNEQYILDLVNKLIDTDFRVNLYGSFYFKKTKYILIQDFGFREKMDFQKDIIEKIGQLYLKRINFKIKDSPIGINSLEIGEYDEEYNLRIEINFKTKNITNLIEKYDILINLIKPFIQEVD